MARYQPTPIQLNRAEGVGYDGRATIKLQPGITYSNIALFTNLVKRATIKKVAVDLNGSEIAYASGEELDRIDQFLMKHRRAGVFVLDFARLEYRTMLGIRQKELITLPTDDVTVIIEFGAKAAEDPTVPTLKGMAMVTNVQSDRYYIPSMYRLTQNIAAAGEHELIFPNAAPNRWLQRLMFKENNATISKIEIYRGSVRIYEATREQVEFFFQRHGERSPLSDYFVLDTGLTGFGSDGAINSGKPGELKFKLHVDGPGAMEILVEGYDQIKQLPQAA